VVRARARATSHDNGDGLSSAAATPCPRDCVDAKTVFGQVHAAGEPAGPRAFRSLVLRHQLVGDSVDTFYATRDVDRVVDLGLAIQGPT